MATIRSLNSDFKPKLVPIIEGNNENILNFLKFPVYVQGIPRGVNILIRSGIVRTFLDEKVLNLEIKRKLSNLIRSTRRMKLTVEAIVTFDFEFISNEKILEKLLDYEDNADNLKIVLIDMLVEHSPNIMDYEARYKTIKGLFKESVIKGPPIIIDTAVVNNQKEFNNQILAYNALGYSKYRVASPKSKYVFGGVEDFYEKGGIADIDSETIHRGKLIGITPSIVKIKNKVIYTAKELQVKYISDNCPYTEETISIDLSERSLMITSKIWENKEALLGDTVVFSGILLPGYFYPKIRKFIRFEKKL